MALRPLRIVIAGGSGRLGTLLARHFHERDHLVTVISRHCCSLPWRSYTWTGTDLGQWTRAIDGADVVLNLAGKSIDCRHNAANRREILESRTGTVFLLGQAIRNSTKAPALWLNASTCGIYRHSLEAAVDETGTRITERTAAPSSSCSLSSQMAEAWEHAFFNSQAPAQTRKVALRTAMVMSPEGHGPFEMLLKLVRLGLGARLGPGIQFVSWIHEVDFIRAIEFLMSHTDVQGAVNICSPCPVPNGYFMRCLRHAWCTTYIGVPLPAWLLSTAGVLPRPEAESLLQSRRIVPTILKRAGFEFHFPNWRGAAQDLVTRWRELHAD